MAHPEFAPVLTLHDRINLPDDEVYEGYEMGLDGAPEPKASTVSRATWHGWRAGRVAAGYDDPDAAMVAFEYFAQFPEWVQ